MLKIGDEELAEGAFCTYPYFVQDAVRRLPRPCPIRKGLRPGSGVVAQEALIQPAGGPVGCRLLRAGQGDPGAVADTVFLRPPAQARDGESCIGLKDDPIAGRDSAELPHFECRQAEQGGTERNVEDQRAAL